MSTSFKPPKEWEDDERMGYLIAPFPPNRALSEKDDKLCFWKKLILSSSKQLDKPHFTLAELKIRFTWKGLSPTCLSKVVEQMETAHVIKKLEDWSCTPVSGWSDWAKQLTVQSMSYMWQQVVGKAEDDHVEYVIPEQIKELVELILQTHYDTVQYETTDNLLSEAEFEALCSSHAACRQHIEIALVRDGKLQIATRDDDKKIYKLARRNCKEKKVEVSSTDKGILRLKEVTSKLLQQISDLTEKSERTMNKCKELVASKQKSSAKHWLQQSKMYSKQVETKESMLTNLQALLTKIQMAETDAMVLEAYQAGVTSLKNVAIDIDMVDQTMDQLEEAVAGHNEVTTALCEDVVGRVNNDVDVNALEKELDALMLQDNDVQHLKSPPQQPVPTNTAPVSNIAEMLPDVPNTNIPHDQTTNQGPTVALVS